MNIREENARRFNAVYGDGKQMLTDARKERRSVASRLYVTDAHTGRKYRPVTWRGGSR